MGPCRLLDRVFEKMDVRTRTHFDPTPSSFGSTTSPSSPYPGVSYECLTINYTNVSAHARTRVRSCGWVCRVCVEGWRAHCQLAWHDRARVCVCVCVCVCVYALGGQATSGLQVPAMEQSCGAEDYAWTAEATTVQLIRYGKRTPSLSEMIIESSRQAQDR